MPRTVPLAAAPPRPNAVFIRGRGRGRVIRHQICARVSQSMPTPSRGRCSASRVAPSVRRELCVKYACCVYHGAGITRRVTNCGPGGGIRPPLPTPATRKGRTHAEVWPHGRDYVYICPVGKEAVPLSICEGHDSEGHQAHATRRLHREANHETRCRQTDMRCFAAASRSRGKLNLLTDRCEGSPQHREAAAISDVICRQSGSRRYAERLGACFAN